MKGVVSKVKLQYLSQEDVGKIHEATLQILEKTGIRCQSERFLNKAKEVGLTVKNGVIFFPREMVKKALSSAPSHFTIYGRDENKQVHMGEKRAYSHTCVGTPFLMDIDTNERREVLLKDLEDFIRVADALPNIDIVSCIFPQDIPEHAAVTCETAAMVKNTAKPLRICVESDHETKYIFEVLAAASGGMDTLRKNPIAYIEVSPISPLDYSVGPANSLLDIVEAGLPLGIIPCPMIGATGPITLIGSVTMHNAEIIAGVVMAQLLSPGHPTIMSPRVTFMDMQTGIGLWAAPEMGIAAACSCQMALNYNIPCTVTGFSCSAKTSDEEAGFESMFNTLLPAMVGVDICGAAGSLDNALTSCYRKLIVDNEIASLVQHAVKGCVVDVDTLAVDVIHEVVNGSGNFLAEEHTIEHLRTELWMPYLSDRSMYDSWVEDKTTFSKSAQAFAKNLLVRHKPVPLSDEAIVKVDEALKCAINRV